jgi:deoxycytidylate deaminase
LQPSKRLGKVMLRAASQLVDASYRRPERFWDEVETDSCKMAHPRCMYVDLSQQGNSITDTIPFIQGEMNALKNCGRLHADELRGATIFTTLSPCAMCTGAILLYGFAAVVIGETEAESKQSDMGGEQLMASKGVQIVDMKDEECKKLMDKFVQDNLELCRTEPWYRE